MGHGFLAHMRINCLGRLVMKPEVSRTRDDGRTQDLVRLSETEGHGVQRHELAVRLSSLLTHVGEEVDKRDQEA